MRKSRIATIIAAGATVALALCGCSAGGSSTSANASGGKPSGTLKFWSEYTVGEAQQKVLASAISGFEKSTGVTVDVQWQGRNVTQKLQATLNTNNVPDLVETSSAKLSPIMEATGQALDLKAAFNLPVDGKTVSDWIPKAYFAKSTLIAKNGDPWMLPYTITTDGVWFNAATNPDLVKNAPKSWDAFISELKKLKADGQTPVAADGDIAGYNAYWFNTLYIRSQGPGSLLKLASDKTGKDWDSPAALSAAKKVQQLVDGGYLISGYYASKFPAQEQKWANNKAALLFNGSWIPTETAPYAAAGFKYDSFPFPSVKGQPVSQRADFIGFAIPKKAKNPKAAEAFAAFMIGKKYQDELGLQAKILPIRSDAKVSPEESSEKAALAGATEFYQQDDGIVFPGYMEKVFQPLDDQLFFGKISAEQFVSQMKTAQIAYWKAQS